MARRFFTRLAVCRELAGTSHATHDIWTSPWIRDFRGELGIERIFVVVAG